MLNFKSFFMKTKNLLWVMLLGVAVSCTVSKRIDKWGYKVSFNKNHQSELNEEAVAVVPITDQTKASLETIKPEQSAVAVETSIEEQLIETNSPMIKIKESKSITSNETTEAIATKMNKKAERIMAKLNSNEAKWSNSSRTELWVYILLILLVPFGTTISMYLYEGNWTKRVTTNLILTLLCGLPGLIHALVVIFGNK